MKRVEIKSLEGVIRFGATLPDDQYQSWIDGCIASGVWGDPGSYTITVTDISRDLKLSKLREIRAPYLLEIDLLVNELALNDSQYTQDQIKTYRRAWLDITAPYKADPSLLDSLDPETITKPVIGG